MLQRFHLYCCIAAIALTHIAPAAPNPPSTCLSLKDMSSVEDKKIVALSKVRFEAKNYREELMSCLQCKLCNAIKRSRTKYIKNRIEWVSRFIIGVAQDKMLPIDKKLEQIFNSLEKARPFVGDGGILFDREMTKIHQSLLRNTTEKK